MAYLTKHGRITVKPFPKVPALGDLPEIPRRGDPDSDVSSRSGIEDGGVDLAEGCFITKTVKYTHKLVHWVNAVRSGDAKDVEGVIEHNLRIIPYQSFRVNHPPNLVYLEYFVQISLDLYAFMAVTPSLSTLDDLIRMVDSDNSRRQMELDESGRATDRSLNFKTKGFVDPEYELIVLHPEHFLPPGNVLSVCDPTTKDIKKYVVARDRVLRESSEPSSPRFPPFRHITQSRHFFNCLNVFLVALNADIKFGRYFRHNPPTTPLPNDVVHVMNRTIELVRLLYWVPVPTKGSQGEKLLAEELASTRKNPARGARPDRTKTMESSFSEEAEMDAGEGAAFLRSVNAVRRRRGPPWPEDADLETRMAIGRALMSGNYGEYDPKLFENDPLFPTYSPHPDEDKANVEAWRSSVSAEDANQGD